MRYVPLGLALLMLACGPPAQELGYEQVKAGPKKNAPSAEEGAGPLAAYPPFKTTSRLIVLEDGDYYPCTDCHDPEDQPADPTHRILEEEHEDHELNHGDGQFWCLTCHHEEDRDNLVSLEGETISFEEPYLLCGQCHSEVAQDFYFGAHGKRVGHYWQGERLYTPCTECHDPHNPSIKPKAPWRAPRVRRGLTRQADEQSETRKKPWERIIQRRNNWTEPGR